MIERPLGMMTIIEAAAMLPGRRRATMNPNTLRVWCGKGIKKPDGTTVVLPSVKFCKAIFIKLDDLRTFLDRAFGLQLPEGGK